MARSKALIAGLAATMLATGCVPNPAGGEQPASAVPSDAGSGVVATSSAPAASTTYAAPATAPLDADDENADEDSWVDY